MADKVVEYLEDAILGVNGVSVKGKKGDEVEMPEDVAKNHEAAGYVKITSKKPTGKNKPPTSDEMAAKAKAAEEAAIAKAEKAEGK